MTLRPKAALLICTISVLLSTALYNVAKRTMRENTQQAEKILARENVARVRQALEQQVASVVLICNDYARWTDAYQYINDGNVDFYENNLVQSTLETTRANVIVFGRMNGEMVFATGFDLKANRKVPLPSTLPRHFRPGGDILRIMAEGRSVRGLMELPEGTLLIAASPITRSDGSGPAHGFVLLGLWWNDQMKRELRETTNFQFTTYQWNSPHLPPDASAAKKKLMSTSQVEARPISATSLAGFTRLDNFEGEPVTLLRVESPRDLYQLSERALQNLLLTTAVLGVVSCVITIFTIDRFILRRVTLLSSELDSIRENTDPAARVTVEGRDELSHLARNTNATLEALNRANAELEKRVALRTEELLTTNTALHAEVVERQMMMGTLRELAAQLERAKDQAERSSQAKNEFLSRMSHELRTPLNQILGFSQLLETTVMDADQDEFVTMISTAGNHLLRLINEVLDFALLESGEFSLSPETVEVRDEIEQVTNILRPLAVKQGVTITFHPAAGEEEDNCVTADLQRFQQIMLNLIANAIKYNRTDGQVEIEWRRLAYTVRIDVRDTGPGLTEEQHARLFKPFDRLDPQYGASGGTGIGLALSRRLALAMNGSLECESVPGDGSTFRLELPAG